MVLMFCCLGFWRKSKTFSYFLLLKDKISLSQTLLCKRNHLSYWRCWILILSLSKIDNIWILILITNSVVSKLRAMPVQADFSYFSIFVMCHTWAGSYRISQQGSSKTCVIDQEHSFFFFPTLGNNYFSFFFFNEFERIYTGDTSRIIYMIDTFKLYYI